MPGLTPLRAFLLKARLHMTNKELKQAKQKLCDILKEEGNNRARWAKLRSLAGELNAPVPSGLHDAFPIDSINAITKNIHTMLQTEMMLNACISAKHSCKWAAIAAFIALLATIAAWITVLLMLKGA